MEFKSYLTKGDVINYDCGAINSFELHCKSANRTRMENWQKENFFQVGETISQSLF